MYVRSNTKLRPFEFDPDAKERTDVDGYLPRRGILIEM